MSNRVLLKDIAEIISGSTAPKEQYFSDKGLPFIRAGHLERLINSNNIDEIPKINKENEKKLKLKKIEEGTILFAKSGMSSKKNRIYLCNNQAYIVNHLAAIKPDTRKVESSYLRYFLEWFKPSKLSNDQSYPSIRISDIGNIEIDLPNKEIQLKVVTALEQAKMLINKRKAQIEAVDHLSKSLFLKMFGDPNLNSKNWLLRKLGEITDKITDGKHGDCRNDNNSGYYFLSAKDINNGKIYYSNARQILKEDFDEVHRRTDIEVGDILLVNTGATIGKSAIVTDAKKARKTTLQKSVAVIKSKTDILVPTFLLHLLRFKVESLMTTSTGSSQKNLLLSQMKNFEVFVPPLELQSEFVAKVSKIEEQKIMLEKSLVQLESNYESILQRTFKGELFV